MLADVCGPLVFDVLHFVRRLQHQLELREKRFLQRLWQRTQVIDETTAGKLLFFELPGRDLFLDRAAEEARPGQAVDRKQPAELLELERPDPLAGLEGADRFLTDAGKASHVFLAHAAYPANLAKFQNHVHMTLLPCE